jgi:hypothetical protein
MSPSANRFRITWRRFIMRIALLTLLVTCLAGAAHAQSPESRSSVSVIAGGGQTFDDESSLGRGWLIGAALDRVIAGSTRAEVTVELVTHDRSEGFFLAEGHTVIAGLSLVQRFGRGRIQPYALAGATAGHHSGTNTFGGFRSHVSSNDLGWRAGIGIVFRAGSRYEISPELRMNGFFVDDDSNPTLLPSAGVRFAIRM